MMFADTPQPLYIRINGQFYKLTACLVHTKDRSQDRPKLMTCIHEDERIELAGGEEFLICYVPVDEVPPNIVPGRQK